MPLPVVTVALITAIASLFTSVTNVGVGVHTAVQTSKAHDLAMHNNQQVGFFSN